MCFCFLFLFRMCLSFMLPFFYMVNGPMVRMGWTGRVVSGESTQKLDTRSRRRRSSIGRRGCADGEVWMLIDPPDRNLPRASRLGAASAVSIRRQAAARGRAPHRAPAAARASRRPRA